MVSYLYRMPAGIPGEITRAEQASTEAVQITPTGVTGSPTLWGLAMMIDQTSGLARIPNSSDTLVTPGVYGVLARPYPGPAVSQSDPLGQEVLALAVGFQTVLRRGYMMVNLGGTAAAIKGGPVFLRINGAGTNKIIGGFEAAADSTAGNTLQLSANWAWMGPADANGNSEICVNI